MFLQTSVIDFFFFFILLSPVQSIKHMMYAEFIAWNYPEFANWFDLK